MTLVTAGEPARPVLTSVKLASESVAGSLSVIVH
jgi:hypothetical protein